MKALTHFMQGCIAVSKLRSYSATLWLWCLESDY